MKHLLPIVPGPRSAISALLLIGLVLASSGCSYRKGERWKFAGWDVRKALGKTPSKPDPETPTRLVTTWTEAVHNRTGETPKRGFGGRLAFFKSGSEEPVRVEGQLVIYAFDESGDDPYKTEPTKRYIFPADQLALYEGDSKLGPSYSIWLPWDEAGGFERKISLIARFEPKDGPIIVGEQTRHLLSGIAKPAASDAESLARGPQLAAAPHVSLARYQASGSISAAAPTGSAPAANQRSVLTPSDPLATTSIPLPRKVSATPGPSLWANRVQQQTFATPQMPTFNMPATSQVQPLQAAASQTYATQAAWQSPVGPTAGYPAATPLPGSSQPGQPAVGSTVPGAPRPVGFQSALPQAQAPPFGR